MLMCRLRWSKEMHTVHTVRSRAVIRESEGSGGKKGGRLAYLEGDGWQWWTSEMGKDEQRNLRNTVLLVNRKGNVLKMDWTLNYLSSKNAQHVLFLWCGYLGEEANMLVQLVNRFAFCKYAEQIFFFNCVAPQLAYIFLHGWTDKLHSFLGMLMLMIQSTVFDVRLRICRAVVACLSVWSVGICAGQLRLCGLKLGVIKKLK